LSIAKVQVRDTPHKDSFTRKFLFRIIESRAIKTTNAINTHSIICFVLTGKYAKGIDEVKFTQPIIYEADALRRIFRSDDSSGTKEKAENIPESTINGVVTGKSKRLVRGDTTETPPNAIAIMGKVKMLTPTLIKTLDRTI